MNKTRMTYDRRKELLDQQEAWLAKFYPVPASACRVEDALEHSIRKWDGLLRANRPEEAAIPIKVHAETCALCHHFNLDDPDPADPVCGGCPLALSRDGTPCDVKLKTEVFSPYTRWTMNWDPKPMIEALAKAKAFVENGGK